MYAAVEAVRRDMVKHRSGNQRALEAARRRLASLSTAQKAALARAYTLYLELVNACENAHRTVRLRERERAVTRAPDPADLVWVLTAHPTESRSAENIRILRRVRHLLVHALEHNRAPDAERLRHLLETAWSIGTHPPRRPRVEDEARHLVSLLDDDILDAWLGTRGRVRARTWVGGDKDGHPGVGPAQTEASLRISRTRFFEFVDRRLLPTVREDVGLTAWRPAVAGLAALERAFAGLRTLRRGDGARVKRMHARAQKLAAVFPHPDLRRLQRCLDMFPALVLPLELREESGRFRRDSTIARMLERVRDLARGGDVSHYARGLVISMTQKPADILEALALVKAVLRKPSIPVIPLFEKPEDLRAAPSVLDGTLAFPAFREALAYRGTRLEVMLGYSDTAKRMGSLASRLAIHEAMGQLEAWGRKRKISLVFFQGSGGSIDRGGGPVEDAAAAWTTQALSPVKLTVQGEMIERTLASPEILRSNVSKIARLQATPPRRRSPGAFVRELAAHAEVRFKEVVADPAFHELLHLATPYLRLDRLTIGSRPSKRAAK